MPKGTAEQLRAAIEFSEMSDRRFATQVLGRDERSVRRWVAGDLPVPASLEPMLTWLAGVEKVPDDVAEYMRKLLRRRLELEPPIPGEPPL